MKNNLLHMHGEFEKRPAVRVVHEDGQDVYYTPYGRGRPIFDPGREVDIHHIHRLWAEGERADRIERSRKRHMLVVVFGVLAFALGVLALLIQAFK
ncbi:hypothetical protein LCGC14_1818090 [marine sediment metagenome]|uniref:Uncharacterized protein n=1 Tax=marine sediment metagenome TaxID=412755 RepID=A0A0F9IZI5_9ZZZZ